MGDTKIVKCSGINKDGSMCSREKEVASDYEGNWYCWQHPKDKVVQNESLTNKQQAFCEEYIVDLNAAQAAIRAGYSEEGARQTGYNLLTNTDIQFEIERLKKARSKRTQITADRVLEELASVGYSKITDYLDVVEKDVVVGYKKDASGQYDYEQPIVRTQKVVEIKETKEMDPDAIKAISEIKHGKHGISLKLYDKLKALDNIGRHLGMWNDKLELETSKKLEDFFKD